MFAIVWALLTLAAVFGVFVLLTGSVLALIPKLRRFGIVVVCGGFLGALAAFTLFALVVLLGEGGREPLIGPVAGVFSAAGFGIGGSVGAGLFGMARLLRLPNRWADRRRAGHAP